MTDIMTDSESFTIEIRAHGNITIENFSAPAVGWNGEDFIITYDAVNGGGQDTCYGKVIDDATGTVLGRWDDTITEGSTRPCTHTLNISESGFKNLTVEVGHTN